MATTKGIDWDNVPLGERQDKELACKLGVSATAVCLQRRKRGIPRCGKKKKINWDKVSFNKQDKELALDLGVSAPAVRQARIKRGIPKYPFKYVDWSKYPLGKLPDMVIARMAGVAGSSVGAARKKFGIPLYYGTCVTTEGEGATYPEALIDLWLHEKEKEHRFQFSVGKYRADWLLTESNTLVEYAGLFWHGRLDIRKDYRTKLKDKEAYYKSRGFSVEIIYPDNLPQYSPTGCPQARNQCIICGCRTSRAKGMCVQCYSKNRPLTIYPKTGERSCVSCDRSFGSQGRGGIVRHAARGLCIGCYEKTRKRKVKTR